MKWLISLLIRFVPRKYLQKLSRSGMKVLEWFYAGDAVECPICRHHYRKFLPYGRVKPRQNALCPACLSLERHRLIWLYLDLRTEFFRKKMRVLHIAPEVCFMKQFENIHGNDYVTGDIESPLAKVKMDIHKIPFAEGYFDVVLCNHVLEHVDNDIEAMREINRVLKPGGWAIMQVPFFSPVPDTTQEDRSVNTATQREKLYGQDDHVRKFGKDYPDRIQRAGLTPVLDHLSSDIPETVRIRHGITAGETLYIGVKNQ